MGPKSNCSKVTIWCLHLKLSWQIWTWVSLLPYIKLFIKSHYPAADDTIDHFSLKMFLH